MTRAIQALALRAAKAVLDCSRQSNDPCHPGTRPVGSLRLSKIAPCNFVTWARYTVKIDYRAGNKKPHPAMLDGVVIFKSLTMTYSHMGKPHTTIGDAAFHF